MLDVVVKNDAFQLLSESIMLLINIPGRCPLRIYFYGKIQLFVERIAFAKIGDKDWYYK
jgi:hypothetical protein